MIPQELQDVLNCVPGIMSGAACFAGTRVPVQALLDTLDDGDSVEDFLQAFPDVAAAQAHQIVHWEQAQARLALGVEAAE